MQNCKPLYIFEKKKVIRIMIVEAILLLLPAIVFAIAFAYCYIRFMGLEDPSQSDIGPDFFIAIVLCPFLPISFGAPLVLFYRRLWKRPISKMKYLMVSIIPSIPLLLSSVLWIFDIFVVIFGPLALVIVLGSMNAVSECATEVKNDLL
ncbi:hypothetical protein [Fibrobacter succinogenes]|uniref:Uncharacterized protein n=1 Tax=Fibrobacter succinogenes TaxID=833 RepID=A0A380S5Y6_FIBSU|nr:hypothetical protein [Fibrobacter succinogenes]PWJ35900.1 hypothetical protein IE02_1961 [Fibrobacter succinogenes subsp. elongatus]SUQ24555.1 hypothetical protein SAMN05661053_1961 [Fibrobacter succinogenes]